MRYLLVEVDEHCGPEVLWPIGPVVDMPQDHLGQHDHPERIDEIRKLMLGVDTLSDKLGLSYTHEGERIEVRISIIEAENLRATPLEEVGPTLKILLPELERIFHSVNPIAA